MYADRPGGSQSIPSVGTKPTAADKQPFIALLETQRLPVIRPFTQNSVHPLSADAFTADPVDRASVEEAFGK